MEGKSDGGDGAGKKSAMALALERMRAKKRNSNGSPMPNGSTPSPRPSEESNEGPIITAAFSTSNLLSNSPSHPPVVQAPPVVPAPPPPFQGSLLTTQNVTMNFVFACNIVFKIPVTENLVLADKEYVAYAFNCGLYIFPGSDVVAEHRKCLYNGTEFKARFMHDDPKRKSFNKVEVTVCGKPLLLFKPESATMVLRLILAEKAFFIQDSALSRVNQFYMAQFPKSSFIYYAKLLMNQELEQYKQQMLAVDCNLLLQRIEQTRAEMSEISEVLPALPPAVESMESTNPDESVDQTEHRITPVPDSQSGQALEVNAEKSQNPPEEIQSVMLPESQSAIEIKEEPLESDKNQGESTENNPVGFSFYNGDRSRMANKEEKNIWFLCKDCHPFRILSEKDESMENHCTDYPDHFQLFPDWYFSKFDLKVEDVKHNPSLRQFL